MLHGEHSAILSTFIKLPFVFKIFVLSIFERLFYTGFTVLLFFCSLDVPVFHKLPKDVTTEEGKTIEFYCDVMGDPPIKVQWSKEDGAVSFGRYAHTLDKKAIVNWHKYSFHYLRNIA